MRIKNVLQGMKMQGKMKCNIKCFWKEEDETNVENLIMKTFQHIQVDERRKGREKICKVKI